MIHPTRRTTLTLAWRNLIGLTVATLLCVAFTKGPFDRLAQAADYDSIDTQPVANGAAQESPFTEDNIRQAVVNGIMVTLSAFGLLGVYVARRASRRGELQSWLQEINSGLLKPLLRKRDNH